MARAQLLALADAAPAEIYGWRPAEGTRSFSAVLVHIATANFGLLRLVGARATAGVDLYGDLQSGDPAQLVAMIRKNIALERSLTDKPGVVDLLKRSFEAVEQSFTAASSEELERAVSFLGETTTVRRVYLRMVAHTHEHMGQAIAYTRAAGMAVPWPDPLKGLPCMPSNN